MKHNIVRLIAKEFLKRFIIALHLFVMVSFWLTAWECPCMCGWRWGWRGRWGWRSTRRRSSWCRPLREDPRSPAIKWGLANSSDQSECNRKWTCSCWQWFRCHIFNLLKLGGKDVGNIWTTWTKEHNWSKNNHGYYSIETQTKRTSMEVKYFEIFNRQPKTKTTIW